MTKLYPEDKKERYSHLFHIRERSDESTKFLYATEKVEVIEKELELCGYFCIVTLRKMTAADALSLYKSRDVSEKLFRGNKNYLGNKGSRSKLCRVSILFSDIL